MLVTSDLANGSRVVSILDDAGLRVNGPCGFARLSTKIGGLSFPRVNWTVPGRLHLIVWCATLWIVDTSLLKIPPRC